MVSLVTGTRKNYRTVIKYNKSLLVGITTTSGCTDQVSQIILRDNSTRDLDAENIVKDSFNYEVSGYSV